ncbi:hypothetical protein LCGC14_1719680 [marine sediment metagenome]|uniref:Creatinine amidohydrolase n=1 Tax=marine sediment metagenome TaxID=412755 RepID=A0A0F9JT89_9ZZZZ
MKHHTDITSRQWHDTADGPGCLLLYILPVGNEEVHGPCLPLGTDTWIAQAFAETCCQAAETVDGVCPLVLPPLPYGYSPTTAPFDGTISVEPRVLAELLKGIARAALRRERTGLMVISIHGGNELFICPAIHEFRDETGKPMLYVNPYKTFAPDLDLSCFANADNSTKETALLRAALTILNKPAILDTLTREANSSCDQAQSRPEALTRLRERASIPFCYESEEQHIASRPKASTQAGLRYYDGVREKMVQIVQDYMTVLHAREEHR